MVTEMNVGFAHETRPARKEFREFRVGEFLYAMNTGCIGVKVDNDKIRFYTNQHGSFAGIGAVCTRVPLDQIYGVPASVDIKVTR